MLDLTILTLITSIFIIILQKTLIQRIYDGETQYFKHIIHIEKCIEDLVILESKLSIDNTKK